MGFDHKGRVLAEASAGYFPSFLDNGDGTVTQRAPFDRYGRRVIVPLAEIIIASFNDGLETVTLVVDAAHGHVFTTTFEGGIGAVWTNLAEPSGVWDEQHPPDASPFAAVVAPGLFVAPNAGDPDVAGRNLSYQVY